MQVNASNNKINKRKKYDNEKFSQPQDVNTTTNQDNFFLLELRAAHGTFNLKPKDLYQLNCSSSEDGCFYAYKRKMYSLFNLKSNYAHINLFHSKEESVKKKKKVNEKNKITTTSTSFFQFPVLLCSNLGYSKKLLTKCFNEMYVF